MDRAGISGALVVASGLVIGGFIVMAAAHLGVETPGLPGARPHARAIAGAGASDPAQAQAVPGGPAQAAASAAPQALSAPGSREEERAVGGRSPGADGESLGAVLGARRRGLGPVDLNSASAAELEVLAGIGSTLSLRIVQLRESSGGRFHSLDELLQVRGIGPATLERIRSCVTIGAPGAADSQNKVFRKSTSAQADSSSSQR